MLLSTSNQNKLKSIICITAAGVLEAGESRVCQVSFQSGLAPQIFSGEIFCYARPEQTTEEAAAEEAMMMGAQSLSNGMQGLSISRAAAVDGAVIDDAGDHVEEVIAEHPPR